MFCFSRNLKFLAFGGLGKIFHSSLATKNPSFMQIIVSTQDHVNHQNPVDVVFNKILERGVSVAQENFSIVHQPPKTPAFGSLTIWSRKTLATESSLTKFLDKFWKGSFRWLGRTYQQFISHQKSQLSIAWKLDPRFP